MKKDVFIKNFLRVIEMRLEKILPEEATEGQYVFKAYQLTSRGLGHILVRKLNVDYGGE